MTDIIPPQRFPGLDAWVCEYDGPDGRYGIILHGSSSAQIIEDNCVELPGLTVLGLHCGTVRREDGWDLSVYRRG